MSKTDKSGTIAMFGDDSGGSERRVENREQRAESRQRKQMARGGMAAIGDVLSRYQVEDRGGYISTEFQDFGYRMAMELGDSKHKALYMKLAKKENRALLEKALSFVKDAGAKNPGALFMWKLKELKKEKSDHRS